MNSGLRAREVDFPAMHMIVVLPAGSPANRIHSTDRLIAKMSSVMITALADSVRHMAPGVVHPIGGSGINRRIRELRQRQAKSRPFGCAMGQVLHGSPTTTEAVRRA